jgi:hypothetical protein
MANNNKVTILTKDTSTIAVRKGGTLLPTLAVGRKVKVSAGGQTLQFEVGYSNPYQLCPKKGSPEAKALHALLSMAPRKDGLAEVTVEVIE